MQPDERDAAYLWDMLDAARTIREFTSGVQFEHGNSNNVPDEWQMSFYSRYKGYVMPNINGKPFIKGQGVILVSELEKPVKARYIRVEVKKPTFEADRLLPWDIEDIRIRENRIGKLWRKVIDN